VISRVSRRNPVSDNVVDGLLGLALLRGMSYLLGAQGQARRFTAVGFDLFSSTAEPAARAGKPPVSEAY